MILREVVTFNADRSLRLNVERNRGLLAFVTQRVPATPIRNRVPMTWECMSCATVFGLNAGLAYHERLNCLVIPCFESLLCT